MAIQESMTSETSVTKLPTSGGVVGSHSAVTQHMQMHVYKETETEKQMYTSFHSGTKL